MLSITLEVLLVTMALLAGSAIVSLVLARSDRTALLAGTIGTAVACVLGAVTAGIALAKQVTPVSRGLWSTPLGRVYVGLDTLSAFFLLCIFLVGGLAAVYGLGYLSAYVGKRRVAPAVALFSLLVAAMAGVVLARDGVSFLLCWEVMSLSSFFLVTFENDREEVRRAGTTYLIASHLGVLLLLALFSLLARAAGSYEFDAIAKAGMGALGIANVAFVLALGGFGTKAGFWPLHTWLPDAHPAAPSHVSALMSGVMIKMGIYGLLRVVSLLGPPPAAWGIALILVGAVSGVAGALHALVQRDLKRVLAYSSVENVGIITMGVGIGLLAQHHGNARVASLAFAGALLHVLNHGLFKGLLFQGAGSVLHGTGTKDIEALGGLYRRMPVTGTLFLLGALAICGLPPFNGFVSEWLVYLSAFRGGATMPARGAVPAALALPALALIGGLAAACFVRAFSFVFLGAPRSAAVEHAHEADGFMRGAMITGAILCLSIGFFPAGALSLVSPAVARLTAASPLPEYLHLGPMVKVSVLAGTVAALVGLLTLLRWRLLRARKIGQTATWGCGYAHPTSRMQYSATSFSDPLASPFARAMQVRTSGQIPTELFPASGFFERHVGDTAGERLLVPAWRHFLHTALRARVIQHGRMQLYLVYVLITLVALVVAQLSGVLGR